MEKFADVLTIINGKNQKKVENPNGQYPIYGSGGIMGRADDYICEANTVVIGRKGSINKPIFVEEPFWNVDTAFGLKANINVLNPKYLYYFCVNFDFEKLSTTVTIPSLTKANLLQISIDIPQLEKQEKIVKELDKVCHLIALRKQQLEKLDVLVKARFVEMFGNFINEKRWGNCEVGDIADIIDPQPSHRTPPVEPNGVPYIGVADCDYEEKVIDFKNARKVGASVLDEHKNRYKIDDGDFIIGKIGTIGKPFFVPQIQNYTLSANTVLIKPIKEKVCPEFLFSVFNSEYMDRIVDGEKKSTSQPAFGIQKVRKIEISLPPIEFQKEFSIFVNKINNVICVTRESVNQLETLKKALMQKYFG